MPAASGASNVDVSGPHFCLEEEDDDEGKPPVRDCSCCGDSAGFAHFSCLTKYAEQKCKQAADGDMGALIEPWEKCNNCKQPFQNQLSINLSSACVSFANATYDHDGSKIWEKLKVFTAHRFNIGALDRFTDIDTSKRINDLLSMIDQTKKDFNMNSWLHMPHDSGQYKYYCWLRGDYEAFLYEALGMNNTSTDPAAKGFKDMITHFKKALAIYKLVGMTVEAKQVEGKIALANRSQNSQSVSSSAAESDVLQNTKNEYMCNMNRFGESSEHTIQLGKIYAENLYYANHLIEAERLATKLSTVSRQVHGSDHKTTIKLLKLLEECKERYVVVSPERYLYQALQYKNDGKICVVKGPISEPRRINDERIHRVNSNLIVPMKSMPVICRGLVSASHLNGEFGEVRDIKQNSTGTPRLEVHFEKKGEKSALVKPENLRIAFELPSEDSRTKSYPSSELELSGQQEETQSQ